MNYGQIKKAVSTGVMRNDMEGDYDIIIHRAARFIADCRTWTWMKKTAIISWDANSTSFRLPGDFKELTDPRSAITSTYGGSTGRPFPVQFHVIPKKELERLNTIGWRGYYAAQTWTYFPQLRNVPVFLDWQSNVPTINLLYPTPVALEVSVDYYAYPNELENDEDTNPLTTDYPELLINKSKAIAFEAINDDVAAQLSEATFDKYYDRAALTDSRKKISGLRIRM